MYELICFGWSFCLFRLVTLKKMQLIALGGEIKMLCSFGIWYSIVSIIFLLVSHLLK